MRAVNIRQLSPIGENTSAYHIFERLNTGGTPLRPQEIRNCVFRGPFNKALRAHNKDPNWRKIIGKKYLDKHQKDVELLLRVFSLTGAGDNYEKPMKEFLNQAMKRHDSGDTEKVKNYFRVFEKVAEKIVDDLGERPFHLRGPLNVSALDSVMAVVIENSEKLNNVDLSKPWASLVEDEEFQEHTSINTTDTKTVQERIAVVKKHFL